MYNEYILVTQIEQSTLAQINCAHQTYLIANRVIR
jgi:hypothetical protein